MSNGALTSWLPAGRPLDDEAWQHRHRTVVALLAAHIVGLAIYGAVRGYAVLHLGLELAGVAALAIAAARINGRTAQAVTGTLGLITCSALLVHLSGGLIEAHFHFFIMVGVVTLYQSWAPFLVAMLYVVIHHGTVGLIDPRSVYNHDAAINKPWLWAGIHGLFITGAALAGLRSWKYAEVERERAEDAAVRLLERAIRQREAIRINDTLVQGLVTAKYAAELGEDHQTRTAIDRTLSLAQSLVSDLMASEDDMFEPGGLRRVAAEAEASAAGDGDGHAKAHAADARP